MEPRTAVAMPWLMLLCIASSGVLRVLAQSTLGFISIDCGGEADYVNGATTLPYTTDAGFIDAYAGSNHNVSAEFILPSVAKMWYTVRSFPSGARNCYSLGSLVAGLKYLIRAQFYYGNYDGLNVPPTFDIYVGVDFWRTVNAESDPVAIAEAIVVVPRDSVQVCLVNTGGGVPFISGLDLRPLDNKLYPQANATQGLVLLHRIDFGLANGSNAIRYPDDPYDRLWDPFPDSTTAWAEISTKMNVEIGEYIFQPPKVVMQTAITPQKVSNNIEVTLDLRGTPDRSLGYIDMKYFAELQQLSSNARRQFNVYRNSFETATAYTPSHLAEVCLYSTETFQASQYKLAINATTNSTLPPIINAIELFSVISTTTVATDSRDASAITAIKEMYQVRKNWMGDPCVPKTLAWDGLNCNYATADSNPPVISNVNVSSSGLNGAISPNFANLKDVQYLDLSNNNLIGSIPDTLSRLPSLVFLDVSNNKLNGSIPSGLLNKIQDGSLDLRYGNNPGLCSNGASCLPAKRDNKLAIHIVVPVLVIAVLVLVAILCFWLQKRRKQGSIKSSIELTNDDDENISLELENRQFTYLELNTITNNFQRQLGRGGFGYVFHGSLENGTEVAVKLRSQSSSQGVKQFLAEAQFLARIHHKNLVSMIGFCKDREHMALVYEFMPQGSLQEHIVAGEDNNRRVLPWRQRLLVALESAQGLEYLHKGCSPPIIHMDVKTANILLNSRLEAKIADFGLSKAYNYESDTHVSTNTFVGTPGYVDPEYQRTFQPSTKSDVYSFGVVLLELVTGKPAILRNPEPITVIKWARQRLARGDIEGVVDARMQGDYNINAIWKTTEIALKCTEKSPLQRPSMTDLVMQLQECLNLEGSYTGGDTEFYTGSIGSMNTNTGYNATTNQYIDVIQENTSLR
ncbi:unnamed protein product [Alopecurus aequalis]